MALKRHNPTSAGRRFGDRPDLSMITTSEPEKSLLRPLKKSGGRNHHGRTTSRFRGGGHKRRYRVIDFKRDKDGVPARVATIEYDPNRTCRIALLHYADGEKRYILAPKGIAVGDVLVSGEKVEPNTGNTMPLKNIPLGLWVHNVEIQPGRGGQLARSAGNYAQLQAKDSKYALLMLPSGEMRRIFKECRATIGQLGNDEHSNRKLGKAGLRRHMGRRPHVRGVAQNPHSHPMGGGEGRSSGGRHPCSPWGRREGKTRKRKNPTDVFIVRRRKKKRR